MAQKFGRNYRLTIYPIDGNGPIIITLPFTISFSCNRNINASINTLSIDIYNLSQDNRRRIFQDINVLGQYADGAVNPDGMTTQYHNFLLEAGYGSLLYKVFYGRMMHASSSREGTNIITRIEATSNMGDIAGTQVQVSLSQAGITVGQVLSYLIQQFPNLKLGNIGNFDIPLDSPIALNGAVWDILKVYTDGKVYEDNGDIFVLNYDEVLPQTTIIDDSTGLLETPRRQLGLLFVTTLMETSVQNLSQMIQIKTTIQPEYNGTYKVLGITHLGTISSAICGDMRSIFALQANTLFNGFTVLKNVTAAGAA